MAELEQRDQQLEREVRELQAMLKTDRERIDRLTNRGLGWAGVLELLTAPVDALHREGRACGG